MKSEYPKLMVFHVISITNNALSIMLFWSFQLNIRVYFLSLQSKLVFSFLAINKKKSRELEMQSLSLKMLTGLNTGASGGRNFERRRRSCNNNNKIVGCLSSSDRNGVERDKKQNLSTSSFASRTHTYALLKQQMEVAAKSEDYKEAARIRDSLRLFEEEEPVLRLLKELKEAVADERFEDAVKLRDELKLVAPHALLKCSSDATTLGVRVQVRSVYIEDRSQPSKGQYFFAYRIRITNNSERPVQLLRRHWIVTDANSRSENVWGIGVIGQQPVILPHTGFEYSSACPLSTPSGKMEGDFEMKHTDKIGTSSFNVAIAPFSLSTLADDSDII